MSEYFGDGILHTLWTKAVGTPGYVKEEWRELEKLVHAGLVAVNNKNSQTIRLGSIVQDLVAFYCGGPKMIVTVIDTDGMHYCDLWLSEGRKQFAYYVKDLVWIGQAYEKEEST